MAAVRVTSPTVYPKVVPDLSKGITASITPLSPECLADGATMPVPSFTPYIRYPWIRLNEEPCFRVKLEESWIDRYAVQA